MKKAGILFAYQSKTETMSEKTFSRMSQPDLLLTLVCYTKEISVLKKELEQNDKIPVNDSEIESIQTRIRFKIKRLEELSCAIVEAYDDKNIMSTVQHQRV